MLHKLLTLQLQIKNTLALIYLQAENVNKSFGDLEVLSDVSLSLFQNQRTALVARNGTGKSTLLNILAGYDTPDSGKIILRNDISVGYLPQEPQLDLSKSVLENVFNADDAISVTMRNYEKAIESTDKMALQHAIDEMDRLNIWDREQKAKQILSVFQLTDINQPVQLLSGGQRKRVALAAVLISNPDLLILDEPTNHLDLEMVEWLEDYLTRSQKTLLMVTHDRYFLDRVCTDIIEIDQKQVYTYNGNYTYFIEKRDERIRAKLAGIDRASNLLRRETEWMRRMPQARETKAKYRIDAFYKLRETALQKIHSKDVEIGVSASRLGKKIMEVHNLSKSFGSKVILKDFSYTFNRFERLGIVGANGTGKTTFLNLITGTLPPDSEEIDPGATLKIGYYRQDGMNIPEDVKVIDVVREIAEVITLANGKTITASQFLNNFLFTPDKQHTLVRKLSGGEKRRLYLLTVLMQNPNFLILDEPTNDLDIFTLNVLEDYLINYPGVVVVVSHDRYFMDKLVDGLLIFEGDGEISGFPGNYTEYREWAKEQEISNAEHQSISKRKTESKRPQHERKKNKLTFAQKKELEKLTDEIEKLEKEKKEIESLLNGGTQDTKLLMDISNRFSEISKLLEDKEMRWLELSDIGE
ncbi:MAG TPA: ABC transporter ATP-binding protein [Bacteroidales bacterium]|nr:ABC transporter ATP-binding protein [Bacteroidales bacterium]